MSSEDLFLTNGALYVYPFGRKGEQAPLGLFYKDTNLIERGFPSLSKYFLMVPSLNTIAFGIKFQHKNFEWTQIFRP